MQVKALTDYAVAILVYLSEHRTVTNARDISIALGITETYLPKILRTLRQMGWISSVTGTMGGYSLCADPDQITIWDVMQVTENATLVDRCLEDADGHDLTAAGAETRKLYADLQALLETYFASVTISDIANRNVDVRLHRQIRNAAREIDRSDR